MGARAYLALGIALSVAIAGAVFVYWRATRPAIARLVEASRSARTRIVIARLTGGFPYRPLSLRQGRTSPDGPIVRGSIEVRKETADDSAAGSHALGVAYLLVGATKAAIGALERVLLRETGDRNVADAIEHSRAAAVLTDLSAAYLQSPGASIAQRLRAFTAADRAAHLDPSSDEAWFNRAMALEKLGLRTDAIDAWTAYVARDATSEWAGEARRRIDALRPAPSRWTTEAARIPDLPEAVAQDSQRARAYVEDELLPEWARLTVAGDTAAATAALEKARSMATLLARMTNDRLAVDAAARATSREVAEAYVAYRHAKQTFKKSPSLDAFRELNAVADRLAALRSPLELRARIFAITALQYSGRNADAARSAIEMLGRIGARHDEYPSAVAQAEWMAGLAEVTLGNYELALPRYQAARTTFAAIGDRANEAALATVIAECLRLLGYQDEVWAESLQALDLSSRYASAQRRSVVLTESMRLATEQRYYAFSRYLAERLERAAHESGDPVLECDALLRRAELERAAGDTAAALRASSASGVRAGAITAPGMRDRILCRVAMQKGSALLATDPTAALAQLQTAQRLASSLELAPLAPEAHLLAGDALAAIGRRADALAELRRGLESYRAQAPTANARDRATFAAVGRRLTDRLVELTLPTDEPAAWYAAMTARDFSAFTSSNPAEAIVAYHVLGRKVLIWVVRAGRRELVQQPIDPANVERLVDAIRGADSPSSARPAGEELYDLLVRPIASRLGGVSQILVVPDGVVERVPFAMVAERGSHRFLIETSNIAIVAAHGVATPPASTPLRLDEATLLVVAAPNVPSLEALSGARNEAITIATRWPHTSLLLGDDATPAAFLRGAASHDIVHFAGHVTQQFDPSLAALRLTADAGSDGRVKAADLETLAGHAPSLVVLSSCAAASGRPTAQGQLNLVRPLLHAGVPAVIAASWDVDDDATLPLMVGMYARLRDGRPPSEALRAAQLDRLAHADPPRHWAGFQLFVSDN